MSNEIEQLKQKIEEQQAKIKAMELVYVEEQEAKIKSMELDVDKLRCLENAGVSDGWEYYYQALQDFEWIGLDDE